MQPSWCSKAGSSWACSENQELCNSNRQVLRSAFEMGVALTLSCCAVISLTTSMYCFMCHLWASSSMELAYLQSSLKAFKDLCLCRCSPQNCIERQDTQEVWRPQASRLTTPIYSWPRWHRNGKAQGQHCKWTELDQVPAASQCVMERLLELVILVLFGQVGLDDLHVSQDPLNAS